jgi:hypothetical protein
VIAYTAIQLYDKGYGPRMISVTPPECQIAPTSKIRAKDRGKAPGYPTNSGWTGCDVNDLKHRCHDYATAKLWEDWGANIGFVVGDGFVIFDNDQGEEFSLVLRRIIPAAPRRFVADPKHGRDAFLMRVVDFVGQPVSVPNRELKFRNGVRSATIQVLARNKQAVIAGTHPGTRSPYVWDRELPEFSAIPVVAEGGFM